jgi:hypothetical protein
MSLALLGRAAGIGGIALGVLVLVLRQVLGTVPGLPATDQAGVVKIIVVGCFVIGIAGIGAWIIALAFAKPPARQSVETKGADSPGVVAGGNVHIGQGSPPAQSGQEPKPLTDAAVRTKGDRSPGVVAGGDTTVSTDPKKRS